MKANSFVCVGAAMAGLLALCSGAVGQSVSAITVDNSSSPDPGTKNRVFLTESTLGGVEIDDLRVSFTHRMAFYNAQIASGAIAQTNKRNVIYEIAFTVEDPQEQGFLLRLDSLMNGISEIDWETGETGTAVATGVAFSARYDDSTDAPESFSIIPGVFGQSTPGLSISSPQRQVQEQSSERVANLGPYVGTTDFVFRFTTIGTPTTNVLLPNNATGFGSVGYGLGQLPLEFGSVDPLTLGHFLTFTVAFAPPCPADVNRDGAVNLADLNLVLANFGQVSLDGDTNQDGLVNLADLNLVLALFGTNCG
jgi:hypothetical protein